MHKVLVIHSHASLALSANLVQISNESTIGQILIFGSTPRTLNAGWVREKSRGGIYSFHPSHVSILRMRFLFRVPKERWWEQYLNLHSRSEGVV